MSNVNDVAFGDNENFQNAAQDADEQYVLYWKDTVKSMPTKGVDILDMGSGTRLFEHGFLNR